VCRAVHRFCNRGVLTAMLKAFGCVIAKTNFSRADIISKLKNE
jgi:hypothetical protein